MKRWLYGYRTVHGDPVALEAAMLRRLRELFVRATETDAPDVGVDGSFTARIDTQLAGLEPAEEVRVRVGVAERSDVRVQIPVHWHAAVLRRAFPTFDGVLELEPLASDRSQLTLAGAMTVPLGPVGAALDAAGMRALGERTVQRLVERMAGELQVMATEDEPAASVNGLQLRVGDVMTPDPLVLAPEDSLRTAAKLLYHNDVSGAPVVDSNGGLVGVLSERDLMEKEASRAYGHGRHVDVAEAKRKALTVGEACSRPARTTVPEASLHDAARAMLDLDVGRLVVVNESRIAGIVTRHDVLTALIRSDDVLQATIEALLANEGEDRVQAATDWGVVTLRGTVTLRSRVRTIPERVAEVDGVIDVRTDFEWAVDDVLPEAPAGHGRPSGSHPTP